VAVCLLWQYQQYCIAATLELLLDVFIVHNQDADCYLLWCILLLQVVLVQELERWNALVIRMHTVSYTTLYKLLRTATIVALLCSPRARCFIPIDVLNTNLYNNTQRCSRRR
jgi:hypothetical protein